MAGVFISYRRSTSSHLARLIFQGLRERGLDTFLDVDSAVSGDLERLLLNQIAARTHFILVLSRGSLDRCAEKGDWLLSEIREAFRLNRNIVPVIDEDFDFRRDSRGLPEPYRSALEKRSGLTYSHTYHNSSIERLVSRFLSEPIPDILLIPTPAHEKPFVEQIIDRSGQTSIVPRGPLHDLLPAPFDLVNIPIGPVSIYGARMRLAAFQMAKYPITNAQFEVFIRAGGYRQHRWWTEAGWRQRESAGWMAPRCWRDSFWKLPDHPVVGVSWYEAVAFCLWLGAITGECIMLPTESQWQRAARGDDDRLYPWGTIWDRQNCNNSVAPNNSTQSTPVTAYAGRGDSSFGVSDMAGNTWEWCRTGHKTGTRRVSGVEVRVLRGGSWGMLEPDFYRVTARDWAAPECAETFRGFRIAAY